MMNSNPLPRKPLAIAIAVVALLWFGAAIYTGFKVQNTAPPEAEAGTSVTESLHYRGCFILASLVCASTGITMASLAVYLASRPDNSPDDVNFKISIEHIPIGTIRKAHPSNIALLLAGEVCGSALLLIAARFFIEDFSALNAWVTQGQAKGAWKVILSLLGMIVGPGITFACAMPARGDVRGDETLRRLVYFTNAYVSAQFVLIGLILLNVVAAVRLPGKLDTTETGFFTLAPTTQEYVKNLDQKVTVYAFLGDSRNDDDMRWMLTTAQDLNPQKFQARMIGSAISRKELADLREKFKRISIDSEGLIVALGEDESRYSFVPSADFVKRTGEKRFFVGEGRFMRELLFLNDSSSKPAIYFTQGNGEMSLETGENANPKRTISSLKTFLETANLSVKPLVFDPKSPKLPDDAAAIVVADPRFGVSTELAAALRAYMLESRPGAKKGKLIVITGPSNLPGKPGVTPTGLEDLLQEMNVAVLPKYLFSMPIPNRFSPEETIGVLTINGVTARNPLSLALQQQEAVAMPNCRPLDVVPQGNPTFTATQLIGTPEERPTWLDDSQPASSLAVWQTILDNRQFGAQKQFSRRPRWLAIGVAENTPGGAPIGRLYVFGSADFFNDQTAKEQQGGVLSGQLMAASIDWLRERPFVEVANKEYGIYRPKPDMDETRLMYLPLGLAVLVLLSLGATVWIVRRK